MLADSHLIFVQISTSTIQFHNTEAFDWRRAAERNLQHRNEALELAKLCSVTNQLNPDAKAAARPQNTVLLHKTQTTARYSKLMQFSSLDKGERFVCLISLLLSCLISTFDCSCIFFFLIFCVFSYELEGLFGLCVSQSMYCHLTGPLRQWAAFAIAQVAAAHAQNTCDLCEVPC